jgi:hypothetical protein
MSEFVDPEAYGLVGDGVADDTAALSLALDAALAGTTRTLKLPAHRQIRIGTALRRAFTGRIDIISPGGTELIIDADRGGIAFSGIPGVSERRLAADAPFQSWTVRLDDTEGIAAGQLLTLTTETLVLTARGWLYRKQCHVIVADVDPAADTVHLVEPLNFHFTTGETTVRTSTPARLRMIGVSLCALSGRAGFTALDWLLEDATLRGKEVRANADVLVLNRCVRGTGNNLDLRDSRYTINVTGGSRHQRFTQITARGVRHPIDANTFAFDTLVEDMTSFDTKGAIECHPSFLTRFVRCRDVSVEGTIGLRGLGCSTEDCTASNLSHAVTKGSHAPPLKAKYAYLAEFYDTKHVRFRSDAARLGAAFCRRFVVEDCHVPEIRVDGFRTVEGVPLHVVGSVEIDERTQADLDVRRVPVLASGKTLQVTTKREGDWQVVNARKIPGLGFVPKLHYRMLLRSGATEPIGSQHLRVALKLKHNWGIWEPSKRRISLKVTASSSTLGPATRSYELMIDQGAGTVRLYTIEDRPQLSTMLHLSLGSIAAHYRPQIEAEGGDPRHADQWWLALSVVVRTLDSSHPVEHIEAEVEETRLG